MPVDASVDLDAVGKMEACEDFNGADVADMMRKASMPALEEKHPSVDSDFISEPCRIKMAQIEATVAEISPSVPKRLQKRFYKTLFKVEERLLLILQYSNCVLEVFFALFCLS